MGRERRGGRCHGRKAGSARAASGSIAFPLRASGAVIGVTCQDGRGAVNLFQQHDTYHLVRPGRGTERHPQFSLAPQFGRKSVRAADYENSAGDLIIAPAGEMSGKTMAIDAVATLVERDE